VRGEGGGEGGGWAVSPTGLSITVQLPRSHNSSTVICSLSSSLTVLLCRMPHDRVTPMVKRLSCLPSKQAARVRLPFGVLTRVFFPTKVYFLFPLFSCEVQNVVIVILRRFRSSLKPRNLDLPTAHTGTSFASLLFECNPFSMACNDESIPLQFTTRPSFACGLVPEMRRWLCGPVWVICLLVPSTLAIHYPARFITLE
jgi:hypothetical protein